MKTVQRVMPVPAILPSRVEAFWKRVKIGGINECWPFQGPTTIDGHCHFWIGPKSTGRNMAGRVVTAHRVALSISRSTNLDGVLSLHTCDYGCCCNPWHLYPGTNEQNATDAFNRKRGTFGSKSGRSKLTEEQVIAIRAEYRPGVRGLGFDSLAKKYGMEGSSIKKIVYGETWTHLPCNSQYQPLRSTQRRRALTTVRKLFKTFTQEEKNEFVAQCLLDR